MGVAAFPLVTGDSWFTDAAIGALRRAIAMLGTAIAIDADPTQPS